MKGLTDSENPLDPVNRIHYLLKIFQNTVIMCIELRVICRRFNDCVGIGLRFVTKRFIPTVIIAEVLSVLVVLTEINFAKNETAGALLIPYVLWVGYGLYLTIGSTVLNK